MAKQVEVRDTEKLIILMLCEIYDKLGVKGEIEPKFLREAIYSGNLWGLGWKYTGIFDSEANDPDTVSEVVDILDMWWFIERTLDRLSKQEKARVKAEAEPFGDGKFRGFDGNNEGEHISIARFLIHQLDRFTDFADRDLNCHHPSLGIHRRMLEVFLPMRPQLGTRQMNADDVIAILKAQEHPENRGRKRG